MVAWVSASLSPTSFTRQPVNTNRAVNRMGVRGRGERIGRGWESERMSGVDSAKWVVLKVDVDRGIMGYRPLTYLPPGECVDGEGEGSGGRWGCILVGVGGLAGGSRGGLHDA